MAKRTPTVNTGAVIQRDLIRRYARRQMKQFGGPTHAERGMRDALMELLVWMDLQGTRSTRKGGLGRAKGSK